MYDKDPFDTTEVELVYLKPFTGEERILSCSGYLLTPLEEKYLYALRFLYCILFLLNANMYLL